jgi:type IV secretion system protein VirB11
MRPSLDHASLTLAKLIAGLTKQDITTEYPICSSVLPGGERAQVVIPPAVERGFVSITIRKASGVTMDIDDFDRAGLFSEVRAHGASEEVDGALLPTAMPATGKPSSASPLRPGKTS